MVHNGQRLKVLNSYVYLSYTLTTKLSVSTALEPITVKAKKKVMDILRALWKIKGTNISIILRLFDHQVQPALTYAAEVWEAKKVKEIEKVHRYACKKALSVSQKTTNAMIYGELGRYPLYINTVMKAVKYWLKLVELLDNRLSDAAYETVKIL